MLKLYIAVLDEVPDHMVPVLVAHTMLNAHMAWYNRHGEGLTGKYNEWQKDSFRKCVVRVNDKEFRKIAELPLVFGGYESTVLEGNVSCIVVCPREENPNVLKFAKLWKPK